MNPNFDGATHVNIYSQGKTELGRLLSNFIRSPFECEDGRFLSIEGYWHWLNAPVTPEREVLRTLYGYAALQRGRAIRRGYKFPDFALFQQKMVRALQAKVEADPHLKALLRENPLPFMHYHLQNGRAVDAGFGWLVEEWEKIRRELQA